MAKRHTTPRRIGPKPGNALCEFAVDGNDILDAHEILRRTRDLLEYLMCSKPDPDRVNEGVFEGQEVVFQTIDDAIAHVQDILGVELDRRRAEHKKTSEAEASEPREPMSEEVIQRRLAQYEAFLREDAKEAGRVN